MNDFGVKETQCTKCSHREVCSYKRDFLDAQEAVNNLGISKGETGDGIYSFINLSDIKWIKPVELQCTYFAPAIENQFKEY